PAFVPCYSQSFPWVDERGASTLPAAKHPHPPGNSDREPRFRRRSAPTPLKCRGEQNRIFRSPSKISGFPVTLLQERAGEKIIRQRQYHITSDGFPFMEMWNCWSW